ncbi:DUF2860 domain-containing protein [Vibrio tubiashii]|uniref:DUF2860 domain-containing protein n=1 Tax=Vibrio tubiashii TaxID=29498 RepID=UPI001EFD9B47|nr:DUF2860 domain-containing protein [Vibrio tubiashii]MCG9582435.1 DUF2860 domain-containing protein [Vibrio tubiashii]MCG9616026.1 DUF2860 domain-containing protein [Vibrio tubiashii]MCG9689201.1 DUF2860 domain-containing protein [Vibrio tubiashii]
MNYRVLLPLGILLSSNALAELGERGLGGEISLLMGYGSETSNSQDTKKGELNSAGEKESSATFAPLGQLRYTFGQDNDQQIFIGTSRGDIIEGVFALEIGYALEYGNESTISFSYLPTIASGEVWMDPFITNTPRKKTDISGDTFRIQVEEFLNLPISGDFAYYQQDVKNEKSGTFLNVPMNELRRDAKGYYVSFSTGFPISYTSFLEPSFSYQRHLADGKAVSFSRYSGSLTYLMMVEKHAFSINGDYSISQYDANHPVFNKTREDNGYSLNLGYEYKGLPGWEDWGFNALAGYSSNSSNIAFYDTNGYFLGVGVSYHF